VPALQFLLEPPPQTHFGKAASALQLTETPNTLSTFARRIILYALLAAAVLQAVYFQSVFRREGGQRGYVFDEAYKEVYDAAVAQPYRPIYLVDGTSPGYVHAYWYATVEGRNRAEFVHLSEGQPPPMGAPVIGSEANCFNCALIKRSGEYILYRSLSPPPYQP